MITEAGDHWTETTPEEVTIGIAGEPGNWVVTLRRGNACLASSQSHSLVEAFATALETSATLVAHLAR